MLEHNCLLVFIRQSEYQYTVYFIRGVDNALTEFGATAVIDTSRCRLDIPLDWTSCVICKLNGTWYANKIVLQSLTVDKLEYYDYYCDGFASGLVYCILLNLNDQTMKYRPADLLTMLF